MAAYRRFVAYVYEYRKDKKGVNCGFVQIEARGNTCRVELHLLCPGLVSGSKCSIYGFVRRDDGIDGILLGTCETEKEKINCRLETSAEHMGGSEHSLDETGGMIITTDQGGFFGTEWDDMPIRPEQFRVVCETEEDSEQFQSVERTEESIQENAQEDTQTDMTGVSDGTGESGKDEENSREEVPDNDSEKADRAEDAKAESLQADAEIPPGQELHAQSVPEQEQKLKSPRMCGTPCDVFRDGELHDCRKISPQDLCRMGHRTCLLRNNRFVQYGYYHFGHLLMCRNHCGQPVLGVPGRYDQQERFMANMFGFPYFKESSEIQVPGGKGGYWYRLIDASNPDNRNGC